MNLTQMLLNRENVDRISEQFGLSEQQAVDAMQSLIPAFSEGLKRQTSTQQGAVNLIQALATGGHVRYADSPSLAMQEPGIHEGNAILGHLFGHKDVSRAVADRASAASGLSGSLLKSLLPVIASMVMGALFKNSTSRGGGLGGALGNALGGGAGGGLLGTVLEGLVGGAASGARPTRRSQRGGGLEDLLGQVLGGATQRQTRRAPRQQQRRPGTRRRPPSSGGGLGDLLGDLLGGGGRQQARPRKQARHGDSVMPPRRRGGVGRSRRSQEIQPEDVFGDMLEPGGNTTRQYRRETSDVFDQLLGG